MSAHTLTARERKSIEKVLANLARPDCAKGFGNMFLMHLFQTIQKNMHEANQVKANCVSIPQKWKEHFLLNFRICDMCRKHNNMQSDSKMLCCSKCKIAHYCSLECQKRHWEEHKGECLEMNNKKDTSEINIGIFRCNKFLSTMVWATICYSVEDVEKRFIENLESMDFTEIQKVRVKKKSLVGKRVLQVQQRPNAFVFFERENGEQTNSGLAMGFFDCKELMVASDELFRTVMDGMKFEQPSSAEAKEGLKNYARTLLKTIKESSAELPDNSFLMGYAMKCGPVVWVTVDCNRNAEMMKAGFGIE